MNAYVVVVVVVVVVCEPGLEHRFFLRYTSLFSLWPKSQLGELPRLGGGLLPKKGGQAPHYMAGLVRGARGRSFQPCSSLCHLRISTLQNAQQLQLFPAHPLLSMV